MPPDRPASDPLSPRHRDALDRFVHLWGEMASSWGVNRTMAAIHALLYGAGEPLDTDAIMARLGISRGNANMNLRALLAWGLVAKVNRAGSRKDFFAAEQDVWDLALRIIEERERREIRPVAEQLDECRRALSDGAPCDALPDAERAFCTRLDSLLAFMRVFEAFSGALQPLLARRDPVLVEQLVALARHLGPPPSGNGASGA